MINDANKHYDKNYFDWQMSIGEFGGWANLTKFSDYIKETDVVLDFGCGGGYLLNNLKCEKKVGVELNPDAGENARKSGIEVYLTSESVPDQICDVIISNHALEHTLHPLKELQELYKKLKTGGKIIFVVPCESIGYPYKEDDINHHLYSWSPMNLGNLFKEAGFTLLESKSYMHKWPPYYRFIARIGGRSLFEIACYTYGRFAKSWSQVRAVGLKN